MRLSTVRGKWDSINDPVYSFTFIFLGQVQDHDAPAADLTVTID